MDKEAQLGFAEAFLDPRLGSNEKLSRLHDLIDWQPVERLLERLPGAATRRRYAPLAMLKAVYLQRLYGLSDPGLEDALLDRISFRRFCGFALDGTTPDETTIWRFRKSARAVRDAALTEIDRQLAARGLTLHRGLQREARLTMAPGHRKH